MTPPRSHNLAGHNRAGHNRVRNHRLRLGITMLVVPASAVALACGSGTSSEGGPAVPTDTTIVAPSLPTTTLPTTTLPTTTVPAPPVPVGTPVSVGGVKVTVDRAEVVESVNNGLARGRFLRIEVTLAQDGSGNASYAPTDFMLELADGSSVPPFAYADQDRLAFGTLAAGRPATGAMAWQLGDQSGPALIIYAASPGDGRAAWQVDLGGA